MHLEDLPLELLAHICLLATDGNSHAMGNLRLTSRTVRGAANIHQFHSVFVAGLASVRLVLDALDQVPDGSARIEHLFICDKPARQADDRLFRPRDLEHPVQENGWFVQPLRPSLQDSVGKQLRLADARDARMLAPLLKRILGYAAPNVKSITFMFFNASHDGVLPFFESLHFPHLRSLALRFPYWMKTSSDSIAVLRMPALQHVTFSVEVITHVTRDTLRQLALDSPILDSVRIEGIQAGSRLIEYIEAILEARESLETEPEPWGYLDHSIYPVDPDPLRPSSHQTNVGTAGELQRFYTQLQRISAMGMVGVEVHGMAASAPGLLEWSARWKQMVKREVLLGALGRI